MKNTRLALILLSIVFCISCEHKNKDIFNTDFETYTSTMGFELDSYIHDSTDCGEWGGHNEKIHIRNSDTVQTISYVRFQSDCKLFDINYQPPKNIIRSYEGILTKKKNILLQEYIKEFKKHPKFTHSSNAPDSYEIRFIQDSLFTGFKIYYTNDWSRYEVLRNQLINDSL